MIRRPPRSTRTDNSFPTRRSSDLFLTHILIVHDNEPFAGLAAELILLIAMCFSHRSEEHTSELQSLMRISYAVFCLKKIKTHTNYTLIVAIHIINRQTYRL